MHALLWRLQNNKLHGCKKIDQIKLEDDVVDDYEDDKADNYEDDKSNDEFRKDNINTTFKNIYHDLEKLRIGLLENDIEQNDDQDEGKLSNLLFPPYRLIRRNGSQTHNRQITELRLKTC